MTPSVRALALPAALAAALTLGACTAAPVPAVTAAASAGAQPAAAPVATASPEPVSTVGTVPAAATVTLPLTFAVVGDSLSLGNSPDFEHGVTGELSWVHHARGDGAVFVGGTAVEGAPSWTQADRAALLEEDVLAADVLVMALGTNDMSADVGAARTYEALADIAATFDAERVLVLAVPPRRYEIDPTTTEFNAGLQSLAAEMDWEYVDAPAPVRDGDAWADGMTGDGIHYTRAAIPLVGAAVGAALRGEE
ncbi:SGNH/GDSL hydrolase family protein [Demequina pelophila]|uniref:SGNH/GDSL hydrolase family protein n=1 Tax=Demequina pelophila TaxID=1638984 RepID=UPI000783F568|nr:SGNH/GDSL hydrolase family protein [Demequina pelophila]